jgi:hypothetical protein
MSVLRSTQVPPQSVEPDGQLNWHVPDRHTSPAAHTLVQLPQCCASVLVLTQTLPHWVRGGRHIGGVTHIRFWQIWPAEQQTPLQSTCPTGQVFTQLPLVQV